MPEPKPPPRRRIAPIPIQPAVEPEPGLISNGAELCQHMPDVSLPPMPGRRMVVDLLSCNIVNYKKVINCHEAMAASMRGAQVHMDDTNSASQSGQGASGSDGAESSGAESTSSEDSKADVVSTGKPGDPQGTSQGSGSSGSDDSSTSTSQSGGSNDDSAGSGGQEDGEPAPLPAGKKPPVRVRAARTEAYEADFIDDTEDIRVQRPTQKPIYSGFYTHQAALSKRPDLQGIMTLPSEPEEREGARRPAVPRARRKVVDTAEHAVVVAPSSTQPRQAPGPQPPQQVAAHPSKVAKKRATEGSSEVEVKEVKKKKKVLSPPLTLGPVAAPAPPPKPATTLAQVAALAGRQASRPAPTATARAQEPVPLPPSLSPEPPAAPKPDAVAHASPTQAMVRATAACVGSEEACYGDLERLLLLLLLLLLQFMLLLALFMLCSPHPCMPQWPYPHPHLHPHPDALQVIRSCAQQPTSARKGTRAFKPVKSLVDCLVAKLGAPADANATGTVSGSGSPAPTRPTHLKSAHLKPQLVSLAQGLIREYGSLEVESAASAIAAVASAGRERWPEGVPMLTAQLQQHLDDALQQIQSLEEGLKTSLASWAASGEHCLHL
ncbi:hypothetical protein QJQ45_020560 [Haematococcus lacustris]|nr:hypothetical protein QJQ45_020560 [Haematococcus lacustris]